MRPVIRLLCTVAIVLGGWAALPPRAGAASLATPANLVFGQPDFLNDAVNHAGLGPASLQYPDGLALDAHGNLYVADAANNRVLEYNAPLTTGMTATLVIGQPNFTHNDPNQGGANATGQSLNAPAGLALDAQGNLYVADNGNNRVLEYAAPLTTGMTATLVIGQPNFTHNDPNQGGANATGQSLYAPGGLALDAQGNLYVGDIFNNRVLKYTAPLTSGMAASLVIGQPGFTQSAANTGSLSGASLWEPYGVAVDATNNLYVADRYNMRVLEYDAPLANGAAANRVLGQPDVSHNDLNHGGLGPASLNQPEGVAVDPQGNVFVTDYGNNRVLEYDAPLTTHAAASPLHLFGQPDLFEGTINNPSLGADSLYLPESSVLDAQGNLYVADSTNNRVLEYDNPLPHPTPTVSSLSPAAVAAGSPAFTLTVNGANFYTNSVVRWNGSPRPTSFVNGAQLTAAISAPDLAGGPGAVTVFTPAPGGGGTPLVNLNQYPRVGQDAAADTVQGQPSFTTQAGNNQLMPGSARLNNPGGAAVDRRTGRLFVADTNNSRVLSWPNAAARANSQPADLVLGQPNLFANDPNYNGVSANSLFSPEGVAVDGQGNLYVADPSTNRVLGYAAPLSTGMAASLVFGQGGDFASGLADNGGLSANSLADPLGVAVDGQGNLYVADSGNNRVLEYNTPFSSGTSADRVFGQPDTTTGDFNHDGLSASSLWGPYGMALDAQGNLFVSDKGNNRVVAYNSPLTNGEAAAHVLGQPGFLSNTANYNGISALSLADPQGLALDTQGNLFVADVLNNRVLEIKNPLTGNRAADRAFGQSDLTTGDSNHAGISAASLSAPNGVALDAQGNLFVADTSNNRVLEYDAIALVRIDLPLIRR